MKVRMITPLTRRGFKALITPEVYDEIEAGKPVIAIGLAEDKKPVGAIAGMMENEHLFYVRSLYVLPEYRRQGGATMLVAALQKLLDTRDALALISYVEEENDESRSLTSFIESRDCVLENGLERMYRGTVGNFVGSGLFAKGFRNKDIHCLAEYDKSALAIMKKNMRNLFSEKMVKPLAAYKNDRRMSYAAMKSEILQGILLTEYGNLHPEEPMIVLSENSEPQIMGGLLNTFFNKCSNKLGKDTYLRFPVSDDRFDRMMERIDGVKNIQHDYLF